MPEARVTALPPDRNQAAPRAILLRATRQEQAGALLNVGGLSVLQRALLQLGRSPTIRVVVAADGTIPMPSRLPANVEVRHLEGHPTSAFAALLNEMGNAMVIGADVVRRRNGDFTAGIRVVDENTRRQAEDQLFQELLRGDLGFVARHINKKISFRITRYLLCRLPITPNQVTLGAAAIGLGGCLLIAVGSYAAMLTGFLLVQLQSVLDGCDGELARIRFQQSAIGEWLDTLVDDFLNLAIVASLGIGLWRAGLGWPAIAGASAAFGMYLVYNVVSYRELVRQGVGGELINIRWKLVRGKDMRGMWEQSGSGRAGAGAARVLLALGRRDTFVFGWLVLAVLNLLPVALLWAVLASFSCFAVAVGQLLSADEKPAAN